VRPLKPPPTTNTVFSAMVSYSSLKQ